MIIIYEKNMAVYSDGKKYILAWKIEKLRLQSLIILLSWIIH